MTSYHAHHALPPRTITQYRLIEHALHQELRKRSPHCQTKHEGTLLKSEAKIRLRPHPKLSPLLIELHPLTMSAQQSPTVTPTPTTESLSGSPRSQHQSFLQHKANLALNTNPHKGTDSSAPNSAHPAPQNTRPTPQRDTLDDEYTGEKVQGVADRYEKTTYPPSS